MTSAHADDGSRLDRLVSQMERLEGRVASLEARLAGGASADRAGADLPLAEPIPSASLPHVSGEVVALIGRTLVALGGAFVLRAVTEAGVLHQAAGAGLGILYALMWFFLADRAARSDRSDSATFHVITATLVAFPLIWETTAKFGYLTPAAASVLLVLLAAVGLLVSWRNNLQRMSSVVTLASVITAVGLAGPTKALVPFACCLLVLSAAAISTGWSRQWHALAWIVAVPVFGSFLLLSVMTLQGDPERVSALIQPSSAVALLLGLVIAYVGSLIAGTLITGQDLNPGQVVLGTLATAIGMGGAILATRATGAGDSLLGGVALICATGCYVASFMFLDQTTRRLNFVFYTTLALAFTLVGLQAVFDGTALVSAFALAAVFLAWVGGWRERATLSLHGAVYVVAAALSSNLLAGVSSAFLAAAGALSGWIALPEVLVFVAAAVCCGFPVARHGRTWGNVSHIPKLSMLAVALIAGGAMLATLAETLLPAEEGGVVSAAALAALRTGVIAALAVLAAWLGRFPRSREAVLLAYPLLIAGGLKLLAEDVLAGQAITMVLSFAFYGGALILVPRLVRAARERASTAD